MLFGKFFGIQLNEKAWFHMLSTVLLQVILKPCREKKTRRKYIIKITDHFFCAFTFHTINIYYYYNETGGSSTIKIPIFYSNKKEDRLYV